MTSLDSGWSSNNVQMTSFCSQTSSSSVHSERTSISHDDCDLKNKPNTSFQHKRLSTMSTGYPPVIAPQRTSSIRSSLRGSQESVSSSRTSQSDIYRSGSSQRRYSSSSSISSSRNGDDSICSMDVRNMIAQGRNVEMFYLNSTLNFGILPLLVFQLEVYHKVDRLLTGLTAQQKGTTARWYSNKTSLQ